MAEYIEREAAVDAVVDVFYNTPDICLSGDKFEVSLRRIPAADVAPVVHGRWVPSEDDFDDDDVLFDVEEWCDWQCNACGEDICYDDPMPPRLLPRFCPNCGAKMDGRDET